MFELDDNEGSELGGIANLSAWDEQITKLSRMISLRYLVHAIPPHQLSDIDTE